MRPARSAPPGGYHLADSCLAILATKLILPEIIQQAKQSLSWHALCMDDVMTQSIGSDDVDIIGQVVPILRAGLVLLEQAATVLPNSQTFHVGYVRNEETLEVSHAPWCAALPHLTLRLSFRGKTELQARSIAFLLASIVCQPSWQQLNVYGL